MMINDLPQVVNLATRQESIIIDTRQVLDETEVESFHFPQNFDHHQSPILTNPCYGLKYRIFMALLTTFIVFVGQILTTPTVQIGCLLDTGHKYTSQINDLINQNHKFASAIQIFSSLTLDVIFLATILYWFLYTRTLRFFWALACFYTMRLLHVRLLQIRLAPGYYWENPGMPSLVVNYGLMDDFFYSGHCGFLLLSGLEWNRVGKPRLFYAMIVTSLLQALVSISFRINYSIDIPGSFVYAHYIYRLTCDYEAHIDYYNKKFISGICYIFGQKYEYSEQVQQIEMKKQEVLNA